MNPRAVDSEDPHDRIVIRKAGVANTGWCIECKCGWHFQASSQEHALEMHEGHRDAAV